MKYFKTIGFLTKYIFILLLLYSCGADDDIIEEDLDDDIIEEVVVPMVRDLEVTSLSILKELIVKWMFPPKVTSVEISYRLVSDDESNAVKNNIRASDNSLGELVVKVSQPGDYIITAVSVDGYGNRSEETSVICEIIQENYSLTDFPKEADPKDIGMRLAERYIRTVDTQNPRVNYPYVCTWLGAFWFAQTIDNEMLYNRLLGRYDKIFFSSSSSSLYPSPNHVDNNVFGSVPLEIYKKTKQDKYLDLGLMYADTQWELPTSYTEAQKNWFNQGYSWQTRIWIDDMFMITSLQTQAFHATGNIKYIDRTAKEMSMYLDRIQRSNGLFYHTPDVPFFWGRGNGWMAVGMAELLRVLWLLRFDLCH